MAKQDSILLATTFSNYHILHGTHSNLSFPTHCAYAGAVMLQLLQEMSVKIWGEVGQTFCLLVRQ